MEDRILNAIEVLTGKVDDMANDFKELKYAEPSQYYFTVCLETPNLWVM